MRNLTVLQINRRNLEFMKNIETNQELLKCVQCAINQSYNDIYVLLGDRLYVIQDKPDGNTNFTIVDDQYCFPNMVSMDFCTAVQELYCAYESGCIAKIDIMNQTDINYSVATMLDSSLQCMKFSPEHDLIAAVTSKGIVITMVLSFDIMSKVTWFYLVLNQTFIKFCLILLSYFYLPFIFFMNLLFESSFDSLEKIYIDHPI